MPRATRARTKRPQLSAFIAQKRATDDRNARRRSTLEQVVQARPMAHFTPARHGLTAEQCREANRLLRQREREEPLRGDPQQVKFRYALRCAGIVSAVRRATIGRSAFGYSLHAHRGGNVMRDHGVHILRANAPRGAEASRLAREKRAAQEIWESTGEVLPIGAPPPQTKEEARVRHLITQWEEAQWRAQHDRLAW